MKDFKICHYCEEPTKEVTKDHVYPISKIKKHFEKGEALPEGIDLHHNKVLSCEWCNKVKGALDYQSFKDLGVKQIRHKKKLFMNKVISNGSKIKRTKRKYR